MSVFEVARRERMAILASGIARTSLFLRRPSPIAHRPSPTAELRPRRNRYEPLRRHSFGFGLEVHDDTVAEHWDRHRVDVVEIGHGAAVHRGARLGAEDEV